MRVLGVLAATVATWLTGGAALACSVTSDFVRQSNYELAENADGVVVAVAERNTGGDGFDSSVTFRVEQRWKGAPPATVVLRSARLGQIAPSDPNRIDQAHPESYMGPCSRYTFQQGRRYVLFLADNEDGTGYGPQGWFVAPAVFGRSSEDYAGPNSLWARALHLYLEVQRNPDRMAALDDLAGRLPALEAANASAADRAIAADIRDHLSSLSPWKPTPYLLQAYAALERGESPRFSIRGPEANREGGFADAATDLIFDIRRPGFDLRRQKESVLLSLINGEHPDAAPLFDRLVAGQPTPGELALTIRYRSRNGDVLSAFRLFRDMALPRLGGLSNDDAATLAGSMMTAMRGPDYSYDEENQAWRTEPVLLQAWPEIALSLWWDMRRRGLEFGADPAIKLLRPADYRDRPEVTLPLMTLFDEAVEAWAISETARLAPTADWLEDEDPAWLPIRTLVMGYGEERDAALEGAICASDSGRTMVLRSLAIYGDFMDDNLIIRIGAIPDQSADDREQVQRALAIVYGRSADDPSRTWFGMGNRAFATLKDSFAGREGRGVTPIRCATP
ncbi:hypothetical protein [Brevundimonas sp. FT23028]|uniref:hypothetical protein n=1 Tax=Brevundimonas sp. FT23028 TaxID=3393748 RepID=UPI003B587896